MSLIYWLLAKRYLKLKHFLIASDRGVARYFNFSIKNLFGNERWDFPMDDIFAKKLRHKNERGGGIKMRDVDIKMEDVRHKKWEAKASRKA